jgi:phosphotransferase system  glucose/maltose/N-acetylglucosamine-specific IIC component
VPLGLHWPLNALMLVNINTLGYDFIQGPMGAWNFACFGATAGVLVLSMRDKDTQMRQTATGALPPACSAASPSRLSTASTCGSSGSTRGCWSAV